jgi:MFS family permease
MRGRVLPAPAGNNAPKGEKPAWKLAAAARAAGGLPDECAVVEANRAATAALAQRSPARRLLAEADFRRLWAVGIVIFAVRWLELLAVAVFVYRHTGSAFEVALMTLLRSLPMALFGTVIGAVAERWERRTALVVVVVSMLATSLTLALLAHAGRLAVWHLAVASFLNGIAWATDNPVRRVMIGEVVGSSRIGAAMSLDVGANNASRMIGPTVGGLLLASTGIEGCFTLSVGLYLIALGFALRLSRADRGGAVPPGSVLTRVVEGLMLVRGDRRLIGVLVITVIYNLFGWPFTSMVPVIGHDNLQLGASGIGVLASMDGIGAFAGAIVIALCVKPRHYAALYIGGTLSYLALQIAFALMAQPVLAGAVLLMTGFANAGFSIMQATLIYLSAPPDMRSRMYGVLSVCIGVSPLGFLHIGLLADAIGAPWATGATGLEGVLALLLTWRWWRVLGDNRQAVAALAKPLPDSR